KTLILFRCGAVGFIDWLGLREFFDELGMPEIWGSVGQTPRRCQSTYFCAMGILRPIPKARLVTFSPGAACSRLYSLRSTRRCTQRTVFSSNPREMMSRALRFSST